MRPSFASALAFALLAAAAPAQITVRTGQNLQAAVDAIPDGGYVLIEGGTYQPIQIVDKSVVLFGLGPWWITTDGDPMYNRPSLFGGGTSWAFQPSPIEARGTSEHWLYVANARLGYDARIGAAYSYAADGIRAEGLGLVYVIDSYAAGARCSEPGESCEGGIGVSTARVSTLVLERALIVAMRSSSTSRPIGSPAVRAPGAHVVLIGVWLQGGEGTQINVWQSMPFDPCPCPWLTGGYGGNAIEAGSLANLGAIFEPGLGGLVYWVEVPNQIPWDPIWHPRGRQRAGPPFVQR